MPRQVLHLILFVQTMCEVAGLCSS